MGGYRKSETPQTRGNFLLLVVMMVMMEETRALTIPSRLPDPVIGGLSVRFRGVRSPFMPPAVTSFSPPVRSDKKAGGGSPGLGGSSSSSSFMPPGVASRAPATRTQDQGPSDPSHTPRPHTWASGAASHPREPTFVGFGLEGAAAPRHDRWSSEREATEAREGGDGWAGMEGPAVQGRQASRPGGARPWPHLAEGVAKHAPARHDTFGVHLTEDLSHLDDRPSRRHQEGPRGRFASRSDAWSRNRGSKLVFGGGFAPSPSWTNGDDDMVVEEDIRSLVPDFNATTEYQQKDYVTYHDYDLGNQSWIAPDHASPNTRGQKRLNIQQVTEIMNLASQADLHALLEQRGITFEDLRTFLSSGAKKKDVIEFLKPPPPQMTFIATTTSTTSPPELSSQPPEDASLDREQRRKNRKGKHGKGGRGRKNKKRKGKKEGKVDVSDVSPSSVPPENMTPTVGPEPFVPSTPHTLPEPSLPTTTAAAATTDTLLPTTTPAPDSKVPPPPSEASIASVTLVEAPFDPYHKTPDETFVEEPSPTRRHDTHSTTRPWENRTSRKFPRPATPSREPGQTVNEIEKVNFVREEQRDDYVFPLRGLLIISGLMGALAVFTLVVLISYAVIKCSKKPVVNNYQVSEQQKSAGT